MQTKDAGEDGRWDQDFVFDVTLGVTAQISAWLYLEAATTPPRCIGTYRSRPKLMPGTGALAWVGLTKALPSDPRPEAELSLRISYTARRRSKGAVGPMDFDVLCVIGRGSFGKVLMVRKQDTKRIYAIKVLRKQLLKDLGGTCVSRCLPSPSASPSPCSRLRPHSPPHSWYIYGVYAGLLSLCGRRMDSNVLPPTCLLAPDPHRRN